MDRLTETFKREIVEELLQLQLAGAKAGHERHLNLKAIKQLKENNPKSTFGLAGAEAYSEEEILSIVAQYTKCSTDYTIQKGSGYIDPAATLQGLYEAALLLKQVSSQKGKVLLATGHTGAMTAYYVEMAKLLEKMGCEVLDGKGAGLIVDRFLCPHCGQHDVEVRLDYVGKVAVTSDGEILRHTHSPEPMLAILDLLAQEKKLPDVVLADHGLAGAALQRGIKTIAVMDTNDPALALAKKEGKLPLTLIPMDDNRPNYITAQVVKIMEKIMEMVC